MEKKFTLKESTFKEFRKKIIIRSMIITLVLVGFFIYLNTPNLEVGSLFENLPFLFMPVIIGCLIIGFIRGVKRQKKAFHSFELIIDDHKIIRKIHLCEDIELPFSMIEGVVKHKNGSLTIKGQNINNSIGVPFQLEGMGELENILSSIVEINLHDKRTFAQMYPSYLSWIALAATLIVFMVENKYLVAVAGVISMAGWIFIFVFIQKVKHYNKTTKRAMFFLFPLLFSVIITVYFKVFY